MSLPSVLLLTCSSFISTLIGNLTPLQVIGILASVIASAYVAVNQHVNLMWKRRRDKMEREAHERPKNTRFNDKMNDDGGRY